MTALGVLVSFLAGAWLGRAWARAGARLDAEVEAYRAAACAERVKRALRDR